MSVCTQNSRKLEENDSTFTDAIKPMQTQTEEAFGRHAHACSVGFGVSMGKFQGLPGFSGAEQKYGDGMRFSQKPDAQP